MPDSDWNPFGREYTPAEVAAAKRLGLAERRKGESLRGPLIYASGPWHPDEARRKARDWTLVSEAMDREWVKPLRNTEEDQT